MIVPGDIQRQFTPRQPVEQDDAIGVRLGHVGAAADAMFAAIGDHYDSFIWPQKSGYDSDRALAHRRAAQRGSG